MATDTHLPATYDAPIVLDGPDGPPGTAASVPRTFDRVVQTATDPREDEGRPAPADPAADHFDPGLAARRADVEAKHRRVIDYLDRSGRDAIVLARADSVAWFTAGGDLAQDLAGDHASAMVYVNRDCRAILADNVQSARIFEEEVAGLGFQLKERPWHDDPEGLVAELAHGRKVVSDNGLRDLPSDRDGLRALRLRLTPLERQAIRELGRDLTLAVEATCRNFVPGETECDLAGHLAHRLLRQGITPIDLRIAGDDRLARFRQPSFKAAPILRRATVAAAGRRRGLCAALTRTVSFGPIDPEFRKAHALAAMVDATCIFFSRPGQTVAEVLRRARRIYEKFHRPHEWMLDYQGYAVAHGLREVLLTPGSDLTLEADMALRWQPSVDSARSEDTVVLDARGGFEVVTEAQRWPKLDIMVKGFPIPRPSVLER